MKSDYFIGLVRLQPIHLRPLKPEEPAGTVHSGLSVNGYGVVHPGAVQRVLPRWRCVVEIGSCVSCQVYSTLPYFHMQLIRMRRPGLELHAAHGCPTIHCPNFVNRRGRDGVWGRIGAEEYKPSQFESSSHGPAGRHGLPRNAMAAACAVG